ncbi:DMT superfamily inner membrane transporter protein (plasmid) [Rhizobium gallicum]|uniref:DMT superfamily inner membrane transporter protein n=2 Tax=Rhizobium gallicum TaxID=56730 RepID=A0A1L5NS14_9HYPH|nr:DMT superfamily inner membrane transporter protein [Rhizobium gallicum]
MNPPLGIALRVLSALAFLSLAGLVKMAEEIPLGMMVFARTSVVVFALIIGLSVAGRLRDLETRRLSGHLLRSLFGNMSLFLWFASLRLLPIAEVTAINYMAPIISVLLAWLMLREEVGRYRVGALLVGLLGMIIIMVPDLRGGYSEPIAILGMVLCLANAASVSLGAIQMRRLHQTETAISIVFYLSVMGMLMSLCTLPFGWVKPDFSQILVLVAAGIVGGIGQLLLTLSLRFATVSTLAPFEYLNLAFAIAIGVLLFDELPRWTTVAGAIIIASASASAVIYWREMQRARMLVKSRTD